MEAGINKRSLEQALGFHGLPLIKSWNEEKGANSLARLGISQNSIDTTSYHQRIKVLNFTDRTKRLRLHQFICDKNEKLYGSFVQDRTELRMKKLLSGGESVFVLTAVLVANQITF